MIRMGEKNWDIQYPMKVQDLLKEIRMLPNMVVIVRNGEILSEHDMIYPSDNVELIRVISGGFASAGVL